MLIPQLFKESNQIGIITYDRLSSLYRRSFPNATVFDTKNIKDKSINPNDWDFQVAMGSLPMLRHSSIEEFAGLEPFLKVDPKQKKELTNKYYPKKERL